MPDFRKQFTFEKRQAEAKRILLKYPDRFPVIVNVTDESNLPPIDKHKYLVPNMTVGELQYVIRKRIKLAPEQAMFMFCNNTLPSTTMLVAQLYAQHKDPDGFCYVTVSGESTFGDMSEYKKN